MTVSTKLRTFSQVKAVLYFCSVATVASFSSPEAEGVYISAKNVALFFHHSSKRDGAPGRVNQSLSASHV